MAMINRDPFAREELHRSVVQPDALNKGCAWCGNLRRNGTLFQYRNETDGGRTFEDASKFCSISCRRAYT